MNIPRPEGFRVDEIQGDYDPGEHTHFTLWKKGWNTLDAIKVIAKKLRVSVDRFGIAGLKDRNAITTQRVSAWRVPKKRLEKLIIKDLKINDIREGFEKISLGSHKGNKFRITLHDVKKLKKPDKVPNLFGYQRFKGTELLGKKLLERDWKGIIELFKSNPGSYERKALAYYRKTKDALRAIKQVDKRIRVLWVNAWQAWLWNKELNTNKVVQEIKPFPMIPEMPELGRFPGGKRETIMQVKGYKTKKIVNGFEVSFTLPTGSYATVLIEFITSASKGGKPPGFKL